MKKCFFTLLIFITCFSARPAMLSSSDWPLVYISPGIKLGYAFGDHGGVLFGWEVSTTVWSTIVYTGAAVGMDWIDNTMKINLSLEAGSPFFGISAGPAFIRTNGVFQTGMNVSFFTGFVIMPYINRTILFDDKSYYDAGTYIKFPIAVYGRITM